MPESTSAPPESIEAPAVDSRAIRQGELIPLPTSKAKKKKKKLEPLLSSADPTWNTPPEFLRYVRELGEIGLDPCGNHSSVVRPAIEWSLEKGDNGLISSWGGYGLVFCNPPYGDELPTWIGKMIAEARPGMGELRPEIVALVPARPDTEWFRAARRSASAFAFWHGRLKFLGAKDAAPFPSLVIYWGPRFYRFAEVFSRKAEIWLLER